MLVLMGLIIVMTIVRRAEGVRARARAPRPAHPPPLAQIIIWRKTS